MRAGSGTDNPNGVGLHLCRGWAPHTVLRACCLESLSRREQGVVFAIIFCFVFVWLWFFFFSLVASQLGNRGIKNRWQNDKLNNPNDRNQRDRKQPSKNWSRHWNSVQKEHSGHVTMAYTLLKVYITIEFTSRGISKPFSNSEKKVRG